MELKKNHKMIKAYRKSLSKEPTVNQSFPFENQWECYRKLALRLWPMLFTLTYFFLIHTLPSFAGKLKVAVVSFSQQTRPQTTVQCIYYKTILIRGLVSI